MEYELLRQEISGIDQQIRELQDHHSSLIIAREVLINLKGLKQNEMIIPAGAGFYFNSTLNNNNSFLVNVGAGVVIEMTFERAEKTINERVDQALSMIVKLNEDADKMVMRIHEIENFLQSSQ